MCWPTSINGASTLRHSSCSIRRPKHVGDLCGCRRSAERAVNRSITLRRNVLRKRRSFGRRPSFPNMGFFLVADMSSVDHGGRRIPRCPYSGTPPGPFPKRIPPYWQCALLSSRMTCRSSFFGGHSEKTRLKTARPLQGSSRGGFAATRIRPHERCVVPGHLATTEGYASEFGEKVANPAGSCHNNAGFGCAFACPSGTVIHALGGKSATHIVPCDGGPCDGGLRDGGSSGTGNRQHREVGRVS